MIHKYRLNNMNIVIDVASGAIHTADDCVYDILDFYPDKNSRETADILSAKYPAEKISACIGEIDEITRNGELFTKDVFADAGLTGGDTVVKALCIHAAHDCNLRCAYCFAKEGGYRGARSLMSYETGKAAVDFLVSHSGNRVNLEIDFFGGEPLMNFDVVAKITDYCRGLEHTHGKRFRFTLTTNGTLLDDEKAAFINRYMDNVVLSLDGRGQTHDRMRKTAAGGGSYAGVLPKFTSLIAARGGERYYIRGTYTRHNRDFFEDVKHIADLGFKYISVEPVVAPVSEDFALQAKDADTLCREYEKLACYIADTAGSEKEFEFFHFNIDLEGGPCVKKRVTGCGAGVEYLAVSPDGTLYPCHQFVGMENFAMGDVYSGIGGSAIQSAFAASNLYAKKTCVDCWAKYYCGGGCAANAYNQNGDIGVPYELGCVLHKKRCECAIMLKALKS